ncbi:MAG TPA: Mur ligase family protein, partial [Candidatus Saccharimonadales bacterium]|nr:Mur ligase family protein [Candidatus Saccharimonadales bacterium]
DGVNERVQINGKPMPEAEFCKELGKFLDMVGGAAKKPSYFEVLTAFALWVFERQDVDYAVLETGLGGLYDATNVTRRPDKICIITDIGFDHMHILGDTLAKIAAQKAGIIQGRNHVFMYGQAADVMRAVRRHASEQGAKLHVLDEQAERRVWKKDLADMAAYQQRNWLLAHGAYRYLEKRDGLKNLSRKTLLKAQAVRIPGRMDIVDLNGKVLVMDGAHNGQKMGAFIKSFQHMYPGVKPAVLISLRDTKDYHDLIPLLRPFAGRVITTAFTASQDTYIRSMDPKLLAKDFRAGGISEVTVIDRHDEAFKALLDSPEQVCMVTGSFYLLKQVKDMVVS